MRTRLVAGVLCAATGFAWAGTVPTSEHFTLVRQGDRFVRLDRASGAMSLCTLEGATGLVCRLAADERATYEARIAALTDELKRAQDTLQAQRDTPAAADVGTKPKGFFELLLARIIHVARRGDEPKTTPDSRHN